MINNPVGIKAAHIAGAKNILADAILRVYTSIYCNHSFQKNFQDFPQMRSWKRFHLSQELLSVLYSGLLEGQDQGLYQLKNLGHFVQGSIAMDGQTMYLIGKKCWYGIHSLADATSIVEVAPFNIEGVTMKDKVCWSVSFTNSLC